MRILHLNTNTTGGAAQAAIRIHQSLVAAGIDSHILFLKGNPNPAIPNAHVLSQLMPKWKTWLLDKLFRAWNYRLQLGKPACFFNSPRSFFRLHKLPFVQQFDMVHLHWVVKFVDTPTFFKHINKPICWTMHDMNPFSGGLHYLTDFPDKAYYKREEQFKKLKKQSFKKAQIGIIGPSVWLTNEAQNSGTFPAQTTYTTIKYPIDLHAFKPQIKTARNKQTILFVAEHSGDNRKGIAYITEAMQYIDPEKYTFLVLGNSTNQWPSHVTQAGFISDSATLATYYAQADVFVIPSIEDNLPNTVIEALASGTPVVGFDSGGIKDMIAHKKNGYLVTAYDAKLLAEGILYVLTHNTSLEMSLYARKFAEDTFEPSLIAASYRAYYAKMLPHTNR